MKLLFFKKAIVKPLMLAAISVIALMNVAKAGGDSYTIYLNGKQLMKQYVTQPLSLSSLNLDNAASNETLVVYYSHCGQVGKGRSMAVKDAQGKVLKQWKFADAAGKDNGMQVPVAEIRQLQKSNAGISLYYSSNELPAGRLLTSIGKGDKTTASLRPAAIMFKGLL